MKKWEQIKEIRNRKKGIINAAKNQRKKKFSVPFNDRKKEKIINS